MGLYPIFLVCRKFETFGENVVLGNVEEDISDAFCEQKFNHSHIYSLDCYTKRNGYSVRCIQD